MARRAAKRDRSTERGMSLVEMVMVLGLTGTLALVMPAVQPERPALAAATVELQGSLDQAFCLARSRGDSVVLALDGSQGPDTVTVQLPKEVRLGKPADVPLPPGMDDPEVADAQGLAHGRITIGPCRTALATACFLHDGRDALCLRLSGRGRASFFRWRHQQRKWVRL